MKKLLINIMIFVFVLMIPFALSSQTRKGIPAGRYESLSGIKVSRTNKNEVGTLSSGQSTVWQEVQKNLQADKNEYLYLKSYSKEINLNALIPNKGFKEAKKFEQGFDLLITEDLNKDREILKNLKPKGLIVFISSSTIKNTVNSFGKYELLVYQSQNFENYYLLKAK